MTKEQIEFYFMQLEKAVDESLQEEEDECEHMETQNGFCIDCDAEVGFGFDVDLYEEK